MTVTDKTAFALWALFGALTLAPIALDLWSQSFRRWARRPGRRNWRICEAWSAVWFVPMVAASAVFFRS